MAKKTIFIILDTETSKKNGMVFDFAFDAFDRMGKNYGYGSYLFKDVLAIEEPFYKDKIAAYWTLVYKKKIKPVSVHTARRIFNNFLKELLSQNYKVVLCAYNAAFDTSHLGDTSKNMLDGAPFLNFKHENLFFLDLWHAWVQGCPKSYGYFAPFSPAGNIRTNAENVYRFISQQHQFEERHIAYSDIIIERVILFDILYRKKKLPLVRSPKDFVSMPWKLAQERCREAIEERKAMQQSLANVIEQVPVLTERKGIDIMPLQEEEPIILDLDDQPKLFADSDF